MISIADASLLSQAFMFLSTTYIARSCVVVEPCRKCVAAGCSFTNHQMVASALLRYPMLGTYVWPPRVPMRRCAGIQLRVEDKREVMPFGRCSAVCARWYEREEECEGGRIARAWVCREGFLHLRSTVLASQPHHRPGQEY